MDQGNIKKTINIKNCVLYEGKAYFSNAMFNAMIVYDTKTEEVVKICEFPRIDRASLLYHGHCLNYGKKIFFFPDCGTGNIVHMYDINKDEIEAYELPLKDRGVQYAALFNDNILLFPYYASQGLIVMDPKNPNETRIEKWWSCDALDEAKPIRTSEYKDGIFWSFCEGTDRIVLGDCKKKSIEVYSMGVEASEIYTVSFDGKDFWIAKKDGLDLFKWNPSDGTRRVGVINNGMRKDAGYLDIICALNRVFVTVEKEKKIFVLDEKANHLNILTEFPEDSLFFDESDRKFSTYYKVVDNVVLLFCVKTNMMFEINADNLSVRQRNMTVKNCKLFDNYTSRIIREIVDNGFLIREGISWDWKSNFNVFLNFVLEK